jgi:hypothetical protein
MPAIWSAEIHFGFPTPRTFSTLPFDTLVLTLTILFYKIPRRQLDKFQELLVFLDSVVWICVASRLGYRSRLDPVVGHRDSDLGAHRRAGRDEGPCRGFCWTRRLWYRSLARFQDKQRL